MANQYKGTPARIFLTDEERDALRAWEGYIPYKRGTSSGDAASLKKAAFLHLGIELADPHDGQSKKFAKKDK